MALLPSPQPQWVLHLRRHTTTTTVSSAGVGSSTSMEGLNRGSVSPPLACPSAYTWIPWSHPCTPKQQCPPVGQPATTPSYRPNGRSAHGGHTTSAPPAMSVAPLAPLFPQLFIHKGPQNRFRMSWLWHSMTSLEVRQIPMIQSPPRTHVKADKLESRRNKTSEGIAIWQVDSPSLNEFKDPLPEAADCDSHIRAPDDDDPFFVD